MANLVALLFGAAIIVLFAYDRFNRASYEGGRQLERLVDLLSPDKLRARRIVLQAYGFYLAALLTIYVFLCAYAELLPAIGGPDLSSGAFGASDLPVTAPGDPEKITTGFSPRGDGGTIDWSQPLSSAVAPAASAGKSWDIGIEASVSLAMALIIVGLAPSFPVLRRFEDWMRLTAHRLAGIPTRVIGAAEDLRRRSLAISTDEPAHGNTLLIPRGDWERMAHYRRASEGNVTSPEDFQNDLELIFATSAWIFDRKLKLAKTEEREAFDRLEGELRKRKDVLILEMDEKSGFRPGDPPPADKESPEPAAEPNEQKRGSWERLARDADDLADDICIMLALYVEHEIIVSDERTATAPDASEQSATAGGALRTSVRQQRLAEQKLHEFLSEMLGSLAAPAYLRSFTMMTALWTLGVVLVLTLFWSLGPGRFESILRYGAAGNGYARALNYCLYAINGFCIPSIIALALRDGGRQSRHWRNLWQAHWTMRMPQAFLVIFSSWVVATLFIVGLDLWNSGIVQGWTDSQRDVLVTLRASFEYHAPTTLRGAVLSLVLVMLLDAYSARAPSLFLRPTWLSSLLWASCAALVMALAGGLTRHMTAWAAALNAEVPRTSLDEIDRGLIVYAALYSALIGFFVVFCVTEAVLHQRAASKRSRDGDAGTRARPPNLAPAE